MLRTALFAASVLGIAGVKTDNEGPSGGSVQKVIKMLGDMAATCKKERDEEEVSFAKFSTWCDMESVNLEKEVKEAGELIESLTAEIGKLQSDVKSLGKAIGKAEAANKESEANLKKAKAQREKDHAAFLDSEKDLSESVDALDRALDALAKTADDKPAAAAASLLQLSGSEAMPPKVSSILSSFVQMMDSDDTDDQAPEANAYESQSGGIVDMLKKLQDEFRGKLGQLQKEEMNSEHAFNMVAQDLTDSIKNTKRDIDNKVAEKARKEEKIGLNQQQVQDSTNQKAEDEKMLADMEVECKEKKLSFGEKQQLRSEEIEAIEKAQEIMSSPDAAGNADKHFSFSQQQQSAPSLAQLRSSGRHDVAVFLASESERLHSKKIALLVEKINADPFAKVKKMIDNMITKLMEEAKADADQEGFCDAEMGKSKITRNKLTGDIDALEASIDEGKSSVIELTERIGKLTKEVGELETAMKEATELRQQEKAKAAAVIKDTKAGAAATQAATNVLKAFYEKAGQATGFVQTSSAAKGIKMGSDEWTALANPAFEGTVDKGHKEGMQTFGKTYKGSSKSGGVLALLEVILSDFSELVADTESTEAEAQNSYEKFSTEAKKNKAMKEKSIEMDTAEKAKTEERVSQDTSDLKTTQDELLAADRFYEKLVPQCVDQGMTFEERTAARESEMESLKAALKLLSADNIS